MKGYLSVRETSYKWNVSERRVNQYVTEAEFLKQEEHYLYLIRAQMIVIQSDLLMTICV